jgi:hypothetical protein
MMMMMIIIIIIIIIIIHITKPATANSTCSAVHTPYIKPDEVTLFTI